MTPQDRLQKQLVAALRRSLAGGKPVIPEAGRLLWSLFIDLSSSRTSNGFGPNPLSWGEIEAWMRIRRWPLTDTHIAILRAMDRAWLEYAHSNVGTTSADRSEIPAGLAQAINAGAFDAVFG